MKTLPAVLGSLILSAACAASAQIATGGTEDVGERLPALSSLKTPEYAVAAYSSSASPVTVMADAPVAAMTGRERYPRPDLGVYSNTQRFSALALGVTVGTGGIGLELATPLSSKWELRGGASFLSVTTSFVTDDVPINGTLHLSNVSAGVDWYPFFHRSFHISPGISMYDSTYYNARIFIAGGQIITLNDQDYTSDPADPIRGTAFINFSSTVAPRLTVGFGNMIPHRDKNWTFPVNFGVQYIPRPTANFQLTGSSCDSPNDCGPIQNDPDTQANIIEQQKEIVDDIAPLRFFPVFSFGVSYKFGH